MVEWYVDEIVLIDSTWGGQSFETESGVPEGAIVTDEMTDGYLEIEATSVALITLQK